MPCNDIILKHAEVALQWTTRDLEQFSFKFRSNTAVLGFERDVKVGLGSVYRP